VQTVDSLVLTFLLNALWQVAALSLLGRSPGTASASPLPAAALAVPAPDMEAVAPARTPPIWKQARFPSGLAWAVILVYGASMAAHAARLVRAWKAEYPLNPGDKPLLWIQMEIRDAGGRPAVDLAFFRNRRQDDGSVRTDQVKTEVSDLKVTGNVLRFRTRGEFQYRDGQPREAVEFDHVFELAGSGEATLRQTWSSLEGRKDAPPPPPSPAVLRRAG
jgi:hypothetical protein